MGRSTTEEANLSLETYFNENYFRFPLLASLCEQIIHVHSYRPSSILEIGKGNGFVSDFLAKAGYQITTFDINEALAPDVVGSILELDQHFAKGTYDLVLCAEVLEHIPFDCFEDSIRQIATVCSGGHAIITLPRAQNIWVDLTCRLALKRLPVFHPSLFIAPRKSNISACHHWEIDHADETRLPKIKQIITKYFSIENLERSRHCPYHRFFSLRSSI